MSVPLYVVRFVLHLLTVIFPQRGVTAAAREASVDSNDAFGGNSGDRVIVILLAVTLRLEKLTLGNLIAVVVRGILHRSVRVVPTRTDARYIPTGKPVELHVQKLAAKRLPRKRYCTAGDLSTIKNIGISLSWKPLQKRSISSLHVLFFL